MSRLIGEAYISLLADASLFRSDADAKLKAASAGLRATARVDADMSAADKKIAALAAALKGLSGNAEIGLNARGALTGIASLKAALDALKERTTDLPLDLDNSKALAKIYTLLGSIEDLRLKANSIGADLDITKAIGKYYTLRDTLENLEHQASSLDANGDIVQMMGKLLELTDVAKMLRSNLQNLNADGNAAPLLAQLEEVKIQTDDLRMHLRDLDPDGSITAFYAKIDILENQAGHLGETLAHMRADTTDSAFLAKIVTMQSQVIKLAESIRNMPAGVDTLPFEADLFKMAAQVEALQKKMSDLHASISEQTILPKTPGAYETLNMNGIDPAQAQLLDELTMKALEAQTAFEKLGDSTLEASKDVKDLGGGLSKFGDFNGIRNLSTAFHDMRDAIKDVDPAAGIARAALDALNRTDSMFLGGNTGWRILNDQIRLFGGALESIAPNWLADVHLWHLGTDAILEFAAAWAPALIAVGVFAAYAFPVGEKIYGQWSNINKVLDGVDSGIDASSVHLKDLGGSFDTIEKAIEPSLLEAFGDYMLVIGHNAAPLATALKKVGAVIDDWGNQLVNWSAKGLSAFDKLVTTGSGDFKQIGAGFEELFRIIGLLIGDLPGYVHALLTFGDGFLAITADVISFFGPVLKVGLLIHGFIVYVGLATTAIIALGRAVTAGALTSFLSKTGQDLGDAGAAADGASSKFSKFGVAIGSFGGTLAAGTYKIAQYLDEVGRVGAEAGSAAAGSKIWNDANNLLANGLTKLPGITRDSTDEFAEVEGEMVKIGESSGKGAGAIKLFSGALSIVPLGAVAIGAVAAAAAIGVGLYFAIKHTTDATVEFDAAMQKLIASSNASNIGQNITIALTKTTNQMRLTLQATTSAQEQYNKAAASIPTGTSQAQADAVRNILKQQEQLTAAQAASYNQLQSHNPTSVYNQLSAAQQKVVTEADTYGQRIGQLTGLFGSNAGALQALNAVGIKAGSVATENNATWAKQYQELTALAAGYGYMGQKGSAAAAQLDTLNIASGTTLKNIQALTQAESGWITMITSGDSSFTAFEQGFKNLSDAMGKTGTSGAQVTVTIGKLSEKFTALGATMSGTSASSLAVRQAFDQQLGAGVTLFGNLQTLAAASGNTGKSMSDLAQAGKGIVAQLLPFAAGSKEATAQVSALAQLMGGPATDNFQTLAKWVGNTKGAEQELNKAQADLTISASNLTTAEKNLGNTLETAITQAQAAAISKTISLTTVTTNLATAVDGAHGKVNSAAVSMSGAYLTALEKTGIGTQNAAQYLNAYLKQLGLGPGAIAAIDAQLGVSQSQLAKTAAATAQNTSAQQALKKATDDSATAFHGLTGTLPGTTSQVNGMWAALVKQDQQMVKTGNDATGAKGEFINFAHDGLGVATSAAGTLWAKFGQQNLDAMGAKAGSTKSAFIDLAEHGLHLTEGQAKSLWGQFALQNLDEMVTKGNGMKTAFMQLAEKGLGLTTSAANTLWNTLKNQYLDTLAGKAGETKSAFEKTAGALGDTKAQADKLWASLHKIAGNYKANVNVAVSGGGKITASVLVSSGDLTTTPATATQQAGQTNKSGKPLPGLAMGGIVPGYAGGGKVGGWHNGGDNVIAGLAGGGAVALQGGETVVPKNLSTHPTFTSFAKYHGIPGYAGGGLLDQPSVAFSQSPKTTSSLAALAEPALAQQIGNQTAKSVESNLSSALTAAEQAATAANLSGPLGPKGAGSIANGEAIFKYLMSYAHMTPTAAAGAIASIWGESGWNPFAQGTGGRGLIGWTPPGTISDGAFSGGLSTQLPQVLRFISTSGDWGVISEMNKASSVFQAANEWGKGVERYGINDVHSEGISLAQGILDSYNHGASQLVQTKAGIAVNGGTQAGDAGGIVGNGYSYAKGGRVRPHSGGGAINEPVFGKGLYSGMGYSFAENGQPEYVSSAGQHEAASNPGMPAMTTYQGQTLIGLLSTLVKQGQQLPQAMGNAISTGAGNGVKHGYYGAQG